MIQRRRTKLDCFVSDLDANDIETPMIRLADRLNSLGPIITPSTPLNVAVGALGEAGGVILMSEGTWEIGEQNFYVKYPNTHFVSLSPGNTVIKRNASTSLVGLVLNADNCSVDGVQFVDYSTNTASMLGILSSSGCTIKNCIFKDVGDGITLQNADWFAIQNCDFIDYREGINSNGGCDYGSIVDNRFRGSAGNDDIQLSGSDTTIGIVGNVLHWSDGSIDYTINNMASAANMKILNVVNNVTER